MHFWQTLKCWCQINIVPTLHPFWIQTQLLNSHARSAELHQKWEGYILLSWAAWVKPDSNGVVPTSTQGVLQLCSSRLLCPDSARLHLIWRSGLWARFLKGNSLSPSIRPLESDTFTSRGNRNDHPSSNHHFWSFLYSSHQLLELGSINLLCSPLIFIFSQRTQTERWSFPALRRNSWPSPRRNSVARCSCSFMLIWKGKRASSGYAFVASLRTKQF